MNIRAFWAALAVTIGIGSAFAQTLTPPNPPPAANPAPAPAPTPAQTPSRPTSAPTARPSGPAGTPPVATTPLGRPPLPGTRRPRTYAQCNAIAQTRKLRGSERRHYVTRCQIGYGLPLFRRRGPNSAPPGGPGAQPVAADSGQDSSGSP